MRITKQQLLDKLSESMVNNTNSTISTVSDPNKTNQAVQNVAKLKTAVDQLNQSLSPKNMGENDEIENIEQPPIRMEMEDHVDDLILKRYGFTYFKPKENNKFFGAMSDQEKNNFTDNNHYFLLLKEYQVTHNEGILKKVFIMLTHTSGIQENNSQENLAESTIFSIIAEAERPRLTKQEFLTFLNKKKNEKH